jgi:hypothetical protein
MTPHAHIECRNGRERFLVALFDRLWDLYQQRVPYAAKFVSLIEDAGGRFVNDHIAFRTIACQSASTGIHSLARLFEALGYVAAACYQFPDKFLSAMHYQHPNASFPKLFISELQSWRLGASGQQAMLQALATARSPLSDGTLRELSHVNDDSTGELLSVVVDWIETLPWLTPEEDVVRALDRESPYAAWVLVHGYNVNHFTALINALDVPTMRDIDETVRVLRDAGIPLKAEIEGVPGSRLRQTATEAVKVEVPILRNGQPAIMPWSYAYFELAERNDVVDSETGTKHRFEGFLGPQATQLFDMTNIK